MKVIDIKCAGTKTIPLEMLCDFQGNLKELKQENYDKLKRSIINNGKELMKEIELPDIDFGKFDEMFYSDPEETPEKLTVYFDNKDDLRALKDKIGIRDSKSSVNWTDLKGKLDL